MSDKDEITISEHCEKPPVPKTPKPKRITKKEYVDMIFKPDISGNSEWVTREQLDETALKLSKNGNDLLVSPHIAYIPYFPEHMYNG